MLGVFIDEYGLNPYIFNGGKFRYAMDWLRILLLVLVFLQRKIISEIKTTEILKIKKETKR
jgi:hypothetical protein